jgi:hypothetical protein
MYTFTRISRRQLLGAVAAGGARLRAQTSDSPAQWSRAKKEEYLTKAPIVKTHGTKLGITGVTRATLGEGGTEHDCAIQTIDEQKARFEGSGGTEINFKDTYKFNIAAYKLDRMLGLNMVPVTVERGYQGRTGSWTWWVDDVLMTEYDRVTKNKQEPPNPDVWNEQMYIVRVFDQLIWNTDRNLGNLVIDKQWQVWMIDHTRAFRTLGEIRAPQNLVKCDRDLLAAMKGLKEADLKQETGRWLSKPEIQGLLKRRDKLVAFFEKKGPDALYTSPRRAA